MFIEQNVSVCTTSPLFLLARDFNAVRLDNLWPLSEYTCVLITHPARKVEIVLPLLIYVTNIVSWYGIYCRLCWRDFPIELTMTVLLLRVRQCN